MKKSLGFFSMPDLIPEGKVGNARIEHFEVGQPSARALMRPSEYVPPGRYARLMIGNSLMMSDTPMERRTNMHVLLNAHGHVIIGGLGLGMLVFPLLEKAVLGKPAIESLTIVEKNPDVVDLVLPHLPDDPRLAVFEADIFTWKPHKPFGKAEKFNVIYFDIWAEISTDTLEDMSKLKRLYNKHLDKNDPKKYIGSWREEEMRSNKRRERREEARYHAFSRSFRRNLQASGE